MAKKKGTQVKKKENQPKKTKASLDTMNYGYPRLDDITVGGRFLFFDTLRSEELQYAQDVYTRAMGILQKHSEINDNHELRIDQDGEQKISAALDFLRRAYEYEVNLEKQIWQNKVIKLLDGTEYAAMAEKCFSKNEIDYIGFINLLGLIETDARDAAQWKRRLTQTIQEVSQFNEEIKIVNNNETPSLDLLNSYGPKMLIRKIYDNNYADRRQISAWTNSMLRTKTINNALLGPQTSRFETFKQIIPDVNKLVTALLRSSSKKVKLNNAQRLGLRSELAHAMLEEVYDARMGEGGTAENLKAITYEEFERMFFKTKPNGKKEISREQLQKLQKTCEKLLGNLSLLQEEGNAIRKTPKERVKEGKNKNSTPVGLTKQLRQRLKDILKDLYTQEDKAKIEAKFSKYEELNFQKKIVRQQFWEDLKSELLPLMQEEDKNRKQFEEQEYIDFINKLLSQNSSFTIYDETEYRGAYGLSNILNSGNLNNAIALKVVGQLLGKTDVGGLVIPLGTLRGDYEIDESAFSQQFLKKFEKDYKKSYEQERKATSERVNVYINEADEKIKVFTEGNSYSVRAQTAAAKKARENLKKDVEQSLKNISSDDEKDAKSIKEALENILIIDETTKFSERYFEGFGFKGGSLGANVYEQIDNICALFEMGGIDHIDQQWLVFATLNSGDALIGHDLRRSLEDYFSTVASLLMFRSGGILAEQVKNNLQPKIEDDGFIRIYRLGPLFVPNSYILKKTYEALMTANDKMDRAVEGSKAIIKNNVTEPVKARTKTEKENKVEITKSVWLWEETYKQYMPKISINIQLLGGFLDILEQLRDRLSSL